MKYLPLMIALAAVVVIMPELAMADPTNGGDGQTKPGVPEIDALAGLAAVGAIGAVVALIRERTKR